MIRLIIDRGNTRTKVGIAEDSTLRRVLSVSTEDVDGLLNVVAEADAESAILASTASLDCRLLESLERMLPSGCLILSASTPLPIDVCYATPSTLGSDRIAAAVGVRDMVDASRVLIVDAGTCVTLDLLLGHSFNGGNISPGLSMRLRAMHCFSAALPEESVGSLSLEEPPFGTSTASALRQGALQGLVGEILHSFSLARELHGVECVALAGGDAPLLEKALKPFCSSVITCKEPVIHGLLKILIYNEEI